MANSGESEQAIISRKKELWTNSKKSITLLRNVARSHSDVISVLSSITPNEPRTLKGTL